MEAKQARKEKAALRRRFAAYRERLSEDEWQQRSERIVSRLRSLSEIREAEAVHCYWPAAEKREIDTRPLIEWLRGRGQTVGLPVVASFEKDGRPDMAIRRYAGPSALRRNRWGIAEPEDTEVLSPGTLDVVVTPAFGAGRRDGHRIGHGRGFYDAFLAETDAPAVGPVYDGCLVEAVPAEVHDVPMDVIVTETQTLRLGP